MNFSITGFSPQIRALMLHALNSTWFSVGWKSVAGKSTQGFGALNDKSLPLMEK